MTHELKDTILKGNIPCKEFTEAIEKGILQREPIFELNGLNYYTFEKELNMICANRYLAYQQDIQTYTTFGMSAKINKDYINEIKEHRGNLEKAIQNEDREMIDKHFKSLELSSLVYEQHQKESNIISIKKVG